MGKSTLLAAAAAAVATAACTGSRLPNMDTNWHLVAPAGAQVEPPAKAHCVLPDCAPVPPPCVTEIDSWGDAFFDAYVPSVPVNETRTWISATAMPPTPFLSTEGEAETPYRGRVAFHTSRISDARAMTSDNGVRFQLDGELSVSTLEWVSPRFRLPRLGCEAPAAHVAVSITAYSNQEGILDEVRNWVENDVLGSDQVVQDAHEAGGHEFTATLPTGGAPIDLLETTPMWKAKVALKVPLSEGNGCGGGLRSSFSIGICPPAFGDHNDTGNSTFSGDAVLALALPLTDRWRLTGAGALIVPGDSDQYDALGIDHETFTWDAYANVEWWVSGRFAVALGLSANGPYTRHTSLPTDLWSVYVNLGLLWRPSCSTEIHLLFSENPGGDINVDSQPGDHFDWNTQRDADFALTLGGSLAF